MAWGPNIEGNRSNGEARVSGALTTAKQQLDQVRTENLEGADRAAPSDLNQQMSNVMTQFQQQKPQKLAQVTADANKAKTAHYIFLAIQAIVLVIGLCLIQAKTGVAIGLIVVAVILHFIFKSIDTKNVDRIESDWVSFFSAYADAIGYPETLHSPASGLYAKIDELFLRSLDQQARGFEMQNRQMKKQMEAMNEQHQEALAAQAEQTRQLARGLDEIATQQRRTNQGLFGR